MHMLEVVENVKGVQGPHSHMVHTRMGGRMDGRTDGWTALSGSRGIDVCIHFHVWIFPQHWSLGPDFLGGHFHKGFSTTYVAQSALWSCLPLLSVSDLFSGVPGNNRPGKLQRGPSLPEAAVFLAPSVLLLEREPFPPCHSSPCLLPTSCFQHTCT